MIEELIQIVKIAPVFIPGTQIPELLIRFVERIRKASEQLRHSQIRLRVTIIHGGIDQPSLSVISRYVIPCPEIPVHEGRPFRLNKISVKM